jgi:hypothetical protein
MLAMNSWYQMEERDLQPQSHLLSVTYILEIAPVCVLDAAVHGIDVMLKGNACEKRQGAG